MSRNFASRRYKIAVFDSYILYALLPAIFYPRPITFKILIGVAILLYLLQRKFGSIPHAVRWLKQFIVGEKKKVRSVYYDIDK